MIFSEAERQIWQPAEEISFWDWLPENFILSKEYSEIVGPYPRELVPGFRQIAVWLDSEDVREVIVRKPTQIGLTTFIIAWFVYRQRKPHPAIFCMADQDTTEEMSTERFGPAFENAKDFHGITVEVLKKSISLSNGGKIKMAWASSVARLASTSAGTYAGDEITKPGYSLSTEEGDAPGRLRQRAKAFEHTGKGILTSTVTVEGDAMHELEKAADCVYTPHLPCPACGTFQPLFFFPGSQYRNISGEYRAGGCVTWDKSPDLDKYEKAQSSGYQCGECPHIWTNDEKNRAMDLHQVAPDRDVRKEGSTRFILLWRIHEVRTAGSISQIVLGFFDAKESGKPDQMQTFYNNVLSAYWSEVVKEQTDEGVRASVIQYDRSSVPDDAVALIATVDQQKYGYWYLVRAWSNSETSWKLEHGFVSTEAELDYVLFEKTWPSKNGAMKIWRAGIDTGGGEHSESGESASEWVYQWHFNNIHRSCQIVLTKGSSKRLPEEIRIGDPIFTLPSGKKLPHQLRLVLIDTTKTKDTFFWRIAQAQKDTPVCPAYVSHQEKDEYFEQLKSEHKVKEGRNYVWKQNGNQANHLLDCEQMQVAVASRLLRGGVFLLREPVGVIAEVAYEEDRRQPEPKRQNPYLRRR